MTLFLVGTVTLHIFSFMIGLAEGGVQRTAITAASRNDGEIDDVRGSDRLKKLGVRIGA